MPPVTTHKSLHQRQSGAQPVHALCLQAGSSPSGEILWRSSAEEEAAAGHHPGASSAAAGDSAFTFRRMLSGDGARLSRQQSGGGAGGGVHALTGQGLRELERQLKMAHARPEPSLEHIAEARDDELSSLVVERPLDMDVD